MQILGEPAPRRRNRLHVVLVHHCQLEKAGALDAVVEATKDGENEVGDPLVPGLPQLLDQAFREHSALGVIPAVELLLLGLFQLAAQ